jgi:hypothetical protein
MKLFTAAATATVLAITLPSAASGAAAAECIDQVKALAAQVGVTTDLPQAQPATPGTDAGAGDVGTDDLAKSGGVIAPPETDGGDMPVVEPAPGADTMATAPDVSSDKPGSTADLASRNSQVQSLLVAARQAAETGDTQACLDQLQKANALLAVPPQ